MKYWIRASLAFLLLAAIGVGCGNSEGGSASEADSEIVLGISPFQDTLLPIIGQNKGWFEEEGLNVELRTLGWDSVISSVASDSVDVAVNNTTGVVAAAPQVPNLIYWYGWNPFTEGSALVGRPDGDLQSVEEFKNEGMSHEDARNAAIEQLEGNTLVTTMSTDMGKQAQVALDSVGLSEEAVTINDLNPDQGLAAFLSGTGDMYLGGIPQRTKATSEGMKVIASGPDLAPPPINGFVTTSDYAEANQEELLKLMHVMFRIIRYCDSETEACGQTIVDEVNSETGSDLTVEDFEEFWQNWENYALNAGQVEEIILNPDGYAYWKDTWSSDNFYLTEITGDLSEPVDADTHFWGNRVQELYVKEYGAEEEGY